MLEDDMTIDKMTRFKYQSPVYQISLVSSEMRQRDDEKSDGRQRRRQRHEERTFLDSADERKKDDEENLADLVPGIDPVQL